MSFCPYCKEIVGNGITECPSCGMSWTAAEQAPPVPRIVNEQPLPPQQPAYQQPPQPAYQQPPQQPQYQQPSPQQYQQPPPQYQQPPPQQYQQPQPQYQQPPPRYQAPPQQYQQPYQQPYTPPRPRKKVGMGSMILAMMGGIGALIASFVFFMQVSPNNTLFLTLWEMDNANGMYLYVWLIPVLGILAIVLALIGFAAQNKGAGYVTGLLGIIVLILPIIFAFHLATDFDMPIQDIFYSSADTTMAEGMWQMFLGGFMAMSAGLMMIGGGFGLARRIRRAR